MQHAFKNKIVIITGGSRGIGAALVKAYASMGAMVYFTYKTSKQDSNNLLQELSSKTVFCQQVNSQNEKEIHNFINSIGSKHNHIDVLINNAGVVTSPFFYEEDERWDETIAINLTGVKCYCQAALKYLAKSSGGNIINISSMSANVPMAGLSAYAASKAGLESLSKVLALEYAVYNIRLNTVAPGLIDTQVAAMLTEEVRNNIVKKTPLRRIGTVDDVVNAVLFLSNNQMASFITGSQLFVTGGKHLN